MKRSYLSISLIHGAIFAAVSCALLFLTNRPLTYMGLISGVLVSLMLFLYFTFYERRTQRKYAKIAAEKIGQPVLYQIDGGLVVGQEVLYSKLYFCQDTLIFISLERTPPLVRRIPRNEISDMTAKTAQCLTFNTKKSGLTTVQYIKAPDVISALQQNGWLNA